eukprot:2482811-Rhodomonas_salina.2
MVTSWSDGASHRAFDAELHHDALHTPRTQRLQPPRSRYHRLRLNGRCRDSELLHRPRPSFFRTRLEGESDSDSEPEASESGSRCVELSELGKN